MTVCNEHSGFKARLDDLEGRTDKMETKFDSIQKLLISTLAATVTSLILLTINLYIKG